MRFTIRDLFWLTFVAALCCVWAGHIQLKNRERDALYDKALKQQAEIADRYRRTYESLPEYRELQPRVNLPTPARPTLSEP